MTKKLLYLSFSPRIDSVSSGLSQEFVSDWQRANPNSETLQRHLGVTPVEGPDNFWITANMTPENNRTAEQVRRLAASDTAIAELHAASHILIATPMFNFGVPWTLKAYIDTIVRVGKTFSFDASIGFGPLLAPTKKLLLVWASAGDYSINSPGEAHDLLTPYVRHIFGFMGVTQVETVRAGNMWGPPEAVEASLNAARAALAAHCRTW